MGNLHFLKIWYWLLQPLWSSSELCLFAPMFPTCLQYLIFITLMISMCAPLFLVEDIFEKWNHKTFLFQFVNLTTDGISFLVLHLKFLQKDWKLCLLHSWYSTHSVLVLIYGLAFLNWKRCVEIKVKPLYTTVKTPTQIHPLKQYLLHGVSGQTFTLFIVQTKS